MRTTALNLASVIGGESLLRVANFLAVVVIARLYGAGVLGLYATVLAYATVAIMIAENGLQISSITEICRSPQRINAIVTSVCALRLTLFVVMSTLLAAVGWSRHWRPELWAIGFLVTLRVLLYSYSQLQFSVLKSLNRMSAIGPIQGVNFTFLLFGIVLVYHYHWTFDRLLFCFIASQMIEIALSLYALGRSGIRPSRFYLSDWWYLLRRSTPVGLTYVLIGMTMRADIIVLSRSGSASDVGHFAAAHMGLVLLYSLSWLFTSVLLTDFTRLSDNAIELDRYTKRWTKFLLLGAGLGAIGFSWTAEPLLLLLYGKEFAIAGRLAAIMVLAVPFILLNALYLSRAVALGAARVYLGTYTATAVLAVSLDITMARVFGAMGIAVAIVIREVVTFLIFRIQSTCAQVSASQLTPLPVCESLETLDV
jgi:O-antigen/teichoic acid export membrane protein